jgi:hypothetical protein
MHLTPAGLPSGIPGNGDEIERATQQAPHFSLQTIFITILFYDPILVKTGCKNMNLFFVILQKTN